MEKGQRNSNNSEAHFKIYLTDFIRGVKKLWWACIALAVLFGGALAFRAGMEYKPQYSVSATFIVSMQRTSGANTGLSRYTYTYDSATAEQLATTFPHILSTNLLQDLVCTDLGEEVMPASVSAEVVNGTNMLKLTTVGKDPQKTYDTLISVIDNYPSVAKHAIGNIKMNMITSPVFPEKPYNSAEYKENFITGATFGLIVGAVLIFLYAVLRNTIRTKEEIITELNKNSLGVMPKILIKKRKRRKYKKLLITDRKIPTSFVEAVRIFRNVVMNSLEDNQKVVLVTSTAPSEGKTTITTNLALSIAKRDKKVVLVDADFRNPSIAPLLNIDMDAIEYEIISDKYEIAFLKDYGIYVLRFILPEYKKDSYVTTAFAKEVFNDLREKFDYILVDTPPCGLVSDAMFVAQAADAAVYVIHQDVVSVSKIKSSLNELLATDIKVLGCVLNGVIGIGNSYGYGYGYSSRSYGYGYGSQRYGYGYGYGYGHGYGSNSNSNKNSYKDNSDNGKSYTAVGKDK